MGILLRSMFLSEEAGLVCEDRLYGFSQIAYYHFSRYFSGMKAVGKIFKVEMSGLRWIGL